MIRLSCDWCLDNLWFQNFLPSWKAKMIPTGVEGVWGSDLKITKITTFDPLTGERRLKCEATPISQLNLFSIFAKNSNMKKYLREVTPNKKYNQRWWWHRARAIRYAVYTVDMVYTVYMIYTVDTVDTVYTIQTALYCINSTMYAYIYIVRKG